MQRNSNVKRMLLGVFVALGLSDGVYASSPSLLSWLLNSQRISSCPISADSRKPLALAGSSMLGLGILYKLKQYRIRKQIETKRGLIRQTLEKVQYNPHAIANDYYEANRKEILKLLQGDEIVKKHKQMLLEKIQDLVDRQKKSEDIIGIACRDFGEVLQGLKKEFRTYWFGVYMQDKPFFDREIDRLAAKPFFYPLPSLFEKVEDDEDMPPLEDDPELE